MLEELKEKWQRRNMFTPEAQMKLASQYIRELEKHLVRISNPCEQHTNFRGEVCPICLMEKIK